MKVVRTNKKIIIDLNDEEDEVISRLEERGKTYLQEAFSHWLKGRIAQVRDELQTDLMGEIYKGKSIKELRSELKKHRNE